MRGFDIASALGDTLSRFVERGGAGGLLPGFVRVPRRVSAGNRSGISTIDPLTSNFLTLTRAITARMADEVRCFVRAIEVWRPDGDLLQRDSGAYGSLAAFESASIELTLKKGQASRRGLGHHASRGLA